MLRLLILAGILTLSAVACDSDGRAGTTDDTPAPVGGGTLMLDWANQVLSPVDSETLEPLSDFTPLPMGHWASNYVSPDGRLLASAIGPTQAPRANLHVFNLKDWAEMFVLEEPEGDLSSAVWSPDSDRLFVTAGLPSWKSGRTLWAVDIRDQSARKLTDLAYWIDRIDVSPDGSTLYVFAFQLADTQTFEVTGAPFLVALDSHTGVEKARVALPGMVIGQRKEEGRDGELYAMYFPGRALSPDGRRYYIAHAEDDEITVVNLEEMAVETTAVPARKPSLFERALDTLLGVGQAEAKGGPSNSRQILVSPDGARLFVTGGRDHEIAADSAGYEPLGLKVLEADTLEIIAQHEGVGGIELSPDGNLLFAAGWSHQWMRTGLNELTPDKYQGSGLKVIDADTGSLLNEFEPGRIFESLVPASDGEVLYLITQQPEYPGLAWKQTDCAVPCQTITVYDVRTGTAIAERVFTTHFVELFPAAFAPQ